MATLGEELDRLKDRKEGWGGYDALPPDENAIIAAKAWLGTWWGDIYEDCRIDCPHVTSSAEGEVVLEWRSGEKKLTAYVHPMRGGCWHIDYVKSWGPDIASEMEDGELNSEYVWLGLWNWFKDG